MTRGPEIHELLERAIANDDDAAEELLREFGPAVLRVVRFRLNRQLRREIDSADIAQAVWHSFFQDLKEAERFRDARALCAFLATIAERKVKMSIRRQRSLKRDVSREQPLDQIAPQCPSIAGNDPTPSENAIASETWERLLKTMPLKHQKILYFRAEGFTHAEIAARLGIAEITVRRALDSLKNSVK